MEERKARLEGVIKIILKACLPNLFALAHENFTLM